MIRSYKTEGIIIRRKNFGEADKILTIFSKHYGKIRAIAKGVRKPTSRKAGVLELFNHCRLVLHKGKNLDIISEAEIIDSFSSWRKDLLKVQLAFYFGELVDKLTAEEQKNKVVFELLKNSLKSLGKRGENFLILAKNFEMSLLNELGFGIPSNIRNEGDLQSYIESITEKKIHPPSLLLKTKK